MPQPTKEHEHLMMGVGTWEGTIQMLLPEPGEPARAKDTVQAIGDFWTQSRFECDFRGQAFVGSGCTGYDVDKKAFVGTWIDSMTTSITLMEGEMKGNTLVMRWDAPDMATGEMTPHRGETTYSKDAYTMTMYMGPGEGTKSMVIDMKRTGRAMEAGSGR